MSLRVRGAWTDLTNIDRDEGLSGALILGSDSKALPRGWNSESTTVRRFSRPGAQVLVRRQDKVPLSDSGFLT